MRLLCHFDALAAGGGRHILTLVNRRLSSMIYDRRARSCVILTVVACLGACSVDLPLPVLIPKDTSVPFPCQSRGCGCRDANECWSTCGCFSDQEKLAWAESNDVEVPDWFRDKAAASQPVETPAAACCCCCKSKTKTKDATKQVASKAEYKINLSLRQQRGCKGQADDLLQNLIYLPLLDPVIEPDDEYPLYDCPCPATAAVVLDLPTPPPRA